MLTYNFIPDMVRDLQLILGVSVNISEVGAIRSKYPFGYYNITWGKSSKYNIEIDKSTIGPARQRDLIEQFQKQIRAKYPELLL